MTLEEKARKILEWAEAYEAKRREADEQVRRLLRVAAFYAKGIDPQEVQRPIYQTDGIATITMKDGSVHRIPTKELE